MSIQIIRPTAAKPYTESISNDSASPLATQADVELALANGGGGGGGGATGPAGPAGPTGPTGPTGTNGAAGSDGTDGAVGAAGPAGATGPASTVAGPTGAAGAAGATGAAGSDGADSTVAGPAGSDGADGADSTVAGPTGPAGAAGADGADGTGSVDSVNTKTGVVVLAKADIGLANVDNTTDLLKPLSTATTTALGLKEDADATILKDADIGVTVEAYDITLQRRVDSDTSSLATAGAITNMFKLTQVEFDSITTPSPTTFYVIAG